MTPTLARLALIACALLAAPAAQAQTGQVFQDPATGLTIKLPAPFELAGKQDRPNYDVAVSVKSTTGAPTAIQPDGSLCGVAYVKAPSNEGLSQAEINAVVAGDSWLATAKNPMAALGKVEQAQTFTQPGGVGGSAVKGGEFVIAPSAGPGAETARLYISMGDPKGRIVVTCAGLAAELPEALTAFRAVRAAVSAG